MANKNNNKFMASLAIEKIAPYLYQVNYDDIDYSIGLDYCEQYHNNIGACSAVRNDNYFGRNFDWYYDNCATFVVKCKATKDRHASIGIAGGHPSLTDEVANSGNYNSAYKYLPFKTFDGINDCGVIIEINVVPTGDKGYTTGTNPNGQDMCATMIVRYILDYADSAKHAIELLKKLNIYCPISDTLTQEYHWMIADKETTYVVELIDNQLKIIEHFVDDKPIMTNFYLFGFDGNTSTAFYKEDNYNAEETTLTRRSAGIERYDILSEGYADADNKRGMINLMKSVSYSKAYDTDTSPAWYSEFVGDYTSVGYGDLSIDSTKAEYEPIFEYISGMYENRQRDGKLWQTVHTSVYDIDQKMLWLSVQEGTDEYKFVLESNNVINKNATLAKEVFDSFESSFADKTVLPITLELYWLKKAVGRYSIELDPIVFDENTMRFDNKLDQYVIDTLAAFMKQFYQEREVSRVNKQISIVTKDISIDGAGHTKTAAKNELDYCEAQSNEMIANQKPTAYN